MPNGGEKGVVSRDYYHSDAHSPLFSRDIDEVTWSLCEDKVPAALAPHSIIGPITFRGLLVSFQVVIAKPLGSVGINESSPGGRHKNPQFDADREHVDG